MDSKWIDDFLCLAETGNFSRAATERFITQPAFSRRIQSLEHWVGATLFDRTNGPVSLTPCGEKFREYARKLRSEMQYVRNDIRKLSDQRKSQANILCLHNLSHSFVPEFLQSFSFEQDTIKILHGYTGYSGHMECLLKGGADIFISYEDLGLKLEVDAMPQISRCEIKIEQLVPVMHAKLREEIVMASSEVIPFLRYTDSSFLGRIVNNKVAPQEQRLETVYETKMSEALLHMVRQGRGVAWLPYSICERHLKEGKICIMDGWDIDIQASVCAYYNTQVTGEVSRRLWDYILEHAVT